MKFDSQLETWLKQSETKDQTGKNTKIKESNYNLPGGLNYKNTKLQWPKQKYTFWIGKQCRFRGTIRSLLQEPFQQIEELFQQQKPQIVSVMGNVSQLMHAGHLHLFKGKSAPPSSSPLQNQGSVLAICKKEDE